MDVDVEDPRLREGVVADDEIKREGERRTRSRFGIP